MEYKHLQIKGISEQGIVEGYVAIFDNIDSYGDIILPDAFTKTLSEYSSYPVLYMHDPSQACGITLEIFQDRKGLFLRVQLDLDVPLGKQVFSGVKKGYINCWSIGYTVEKDSMNKQGNRLLHSIRLLECSLITKHFSANPEALVTGFKSNSNRYQSNEDSEGEFMDSMYGGEMAEDMKRMKRRHEKLRDDHEELRDEHDDLKREHRKMKEMMKACMKRLAIRDDEYDDYKDIVASGIIDTERDGKSLFF